RKRSTLAPNASTTPSSKARLGCSRHEVFVRSWFDAVDHCCTSAGGLVNFILARACGTRTRVRSLGADWLYLAGLACVDHGSGPYNSRRPPAQSCGGLWHIAQSVRG